MEAMKKDRAAGAGSSWAAGLQMESTTHHDYYIILYHIYYIIYWTIIIYTYVALMHLEDSDSLIHQVVAWRFETSGIDLDLWIHQHLRCLSSAVLQ